MKQAWTVLSLGLCVVVGCNQEGGATASAPSATPEAKTTAAPKTTAAATNAAATAAATSTAASTVAPLPAGRSAVPTLDEWNNLKKEVTVKGSSALNCETKIVRE